jgi:hypothetical protein
MRSPNPRSSMRSANSPTRKGSPEACDSTSSRILERGSSPGGTWSEGAAADVRRSISSSSVPYGPRRKRPRDRKPTGRPVLPAVTRSATTSPTTLVNLKPWPEHAEQTTTLWNWG